MIFTRLAASAASHWHSAASPPIDSPPAQPESFFQKNSLQTAPQTSLAFLTPAILGFHENWATTEAIPYILGGLLFKGAATYFGATIYKTYTAIEMSPVHTDAALESSFINLPDHPLKISLQEFLKSRGGIKIYQAEKTKNLLDQAHALAQNLEDWHSLQMKTESQFTISEIINLELIHKQNAILTELKKPISQTRLDRIAKEIHDLAIRVKTCTRLIKLQQQK